MLSPYTLAAVSRSCSYILDASTHSWCISRASLSSSSNLWLLARARSMPFSACDTGWRICRRTWPDKRGHHVLRMLFMWYT